jgi:hypothetical protein
MSRRAVYLLSIVVALFVFATPAAPLGAETIDKLTYLTFSGTVQVPGVRLDPGTYRFRLANPDTSRNVIQVLSHDGSTVYAMFHTMPDSRTTVTKESTVTFRETPAGVPPAIKSLFYGGEHGGYEFEYPKGGLFVTAELTPQPEITYAPKTVVAVTEPSPEAEARAEPAKAEPAPEPAPTPEPAESAVAAPAAEAQAPQPELPRTASPVPLVAVGGFASILVGLGAGLIRRFIS